MVAPLYSGVLDDYLECLVCGTRRARSDPYSDLQLFVEKAASVGEAFANFVAAETLDGSNRVFCAKCATNTDAAKVK